MNISISGQVIDSDSGEPMQDVVIRVYEFPKWNSFSSEFKPLLSAVSDSNGFFSFNVKQGASIELVSIVADSEKIGAMYRLEKVSDHVKDIVLKHRYESIGIIEEPPRILVK